MKRARLSLLLASLLFASTAAAGERGYVGVSVKYEEQESEGRLVVDTVYPGSPAAQAGLRVGDVVSRVNEVAFRFSDWTATVQNGGPFAWAKPGDRLRLDVSRGGKEILVELEAAEIPPHIAEAQRQFQTTLRQRNGAIVYDRLAKLGVVVKVEVIGADGQVRAAAEGLAEDESEGLSQFLSTSRLRVLFAKAKPGDVLLVKLGTVPGTNDVTVEIVPP